MPYIAKSCKNVSQKIAKVTTIRQKLPRAAQMLSKSCWPTADLKGRPQKLAKNRPQ